MKNKNFAMATLVILVATYSILSLSAMAKPSAVTFNQPLKHWLLPDKPPAPDNNEWTRDRAALGKMLYFDPRLSGNGMVSCASCHNPMLGWSDGLGKGIGIDGARLNRASPVVTNTAYNYIQMWDGRKRNLEDQATGPMDSPDEMHTNYEQMFRFLNTSIGYRHAFERAYPGQGINKTTVAKAIASFERTIVSNNSPFDQWIKGNNDAMTTAQIRGFKLFINPEKGDCARCHSAPNFVDDGFHNIGINDGDTGRYAIKKIGVLKGAFKTPTLRDIALSAPYFHDGSAATLMDVVEHYNRGGDRNTPGLIAINPLGLNGQEKLDLVEFMKALTTKPEPYTLPVLPLK
ncbi:MAG: cytochrome-c peroxidase [Psychrobium sp.]